METETTKPSNPKDMIGGSKLPLHLWPTTATAMGSIGLLNGMLKYGRANWREVGVRSSIYVDALLRHMALWMEGEECDQDDGVPHLSAALACLAIIIDARAAGKLNDDRNYPGGYKELVDELTPHVARLKDMHKDRHPKHYVMGVTTDKQKEDRKEMFHRINKYDEMDKQNEGNTEVGDFEIAVDEHIRATVAGYPPDHKVRRVIVSTWMANTIFSPGIWKRPLILLTLGGYPVDIGHKHKDNEWWVEFEGKTHPAGIHSLPEEIMNMKRDTSTPVTIALNVMKELGRQLNNVYVCTDEPIDSLHVSTAIYNIISTNREPSYGAYRVLGHQVSVARLLKDNEWFISFRHIVAEELVRTRHIPDSIMKGTATTGTPVVLGTIESAIANSILSVVDELPQATTKVKKLWVSRHISTILGSGAWSPVCAIGPYQTSVDDTIKDDEWYIEIEGQDARSYSRKYFTKRVPACAFMGVYARSQSTGEVKE